MKITNKQIEEIIDIVLDYADYDVDVMGPQDYDVTPSMTKTGQEQTRVVVNEILNKGGIFRWIIRKMSSKLS